MRGGGWRWGYLVVAVGAWSVREPVWPSGKALGW